MKTYWGGASGLAVLVVMACGSSDANTPPGSDVSPDGSDAIPVGGKPPNGIYVSSSLGFDDGDGAMTRPFRSLSKAFEHAKSVNLPVVACAEEYQEALVLIDGVRAYGYYSCNPTWARSTAHATIISPTSPAITAQDLASGAQLEGFDVSVAPFPSPQIGVSAQSSISVFVKNSRDVLFREMQIASGPGQDGIDGSSATESNGPAGDPAKTAGGASVQESCTDVSEAPCGGSTFVKCITHTSGSQGGTNLCKVGSPGGPGGDGGNGAKFVNRIRVNELTPLQYEGTPDVATSETAKGGAGYGEAGANGAAGLPGDVGDVGVWTYTVDGFVPGNGKAGGLGNPGQGGGGGAGWDGFQGTVGQTSPPAGSAKTCWSAAGAGGGAGGCGAIPGSAGTGGGGSFGMVILSSDVSLERCRVASAKGGRAGRGGEGSAPMAGGTGGYGSTLGSHYGGRGGDGGTGGAAGLSGSGSAGPSIALVYYGARPSTVDVELVPGEAGDGPGEIVLGSQKLPAVQRYSSRELQLR